MTTEFIFRLEMLVGQATREVPADRWSHKDGWLIFERKQATGGSVEYWRVRLDHVISIETKRTL